MKKRLIVGAVFAAVLSLSVAGLMQACGSSEITCPACNGAGVLKSKYSDDIMYQSLFGSQPTVCPACGGKGKGPKDELEKAYNLMKGMFPDPPNPTPKPNPQGDECWDCNGLKICNMCAGNGIRMYHNSYLGQDDIIECSKCHGRGVCPTCHGTGRRSL